MVERFEWLLRRNDSYFTIVIENDNNKIVAVGSLLVEAKLSLPSLVPPFNPIPSPFPMLKWPQLIVASTRAHWQATSKTSQSPNQNKAKNSASK